MKKLLMGIGIVMSTSVFAAPAIHVGAMYDFIEPERNTLIKQIRNSGSSTGYVRINVAEIEFDHDGNAQEKVIDREQLLSGKGSGLVASPDRMIVPASGMQINRMLTVGSREAERYYRVRYVPVVPDGTMGFGLDEDDLTSYKKEVTAGVTIMTGYGTIVTVKPKKSVYDTHINETDKYVVFTNHGNSTIIFDVYAECSEKLTNCHTYRVHHIRPGTSMTLNKMKGKSFQFTLVEGRKKTKMAFGDL